MSTDKTTEKRGGVFGDYSIGGFFLEFSIPLILGVLLALLWANEKSLVFNFNSYSEFVYGELVPGFYLLKQKVTVYFLVNDVFMVFFFGIAAAEIVNSLSPGGVLNPIKKSINPLFATMGGVVVPILLFFILSYSVPMEDIMVDGVTFSDIINGWGVPTATDIALAWLFAGLILGRRHPAISFLLLIAIADDAIGLVIIAVFYPSAEFPVQPQFLLITLAAMGIAYLLRRKKVNDVGAYLLLAGFPSWLGLILSHLHPALALVPIIPFLPKNDKFDCVHDFEDRFKQPVDIGLFLFGIANAGVLISGVNQITWIIFLSLFAGKMIGISSFSFIAEKFFHFPLPVGVGYRVIFIISIIAGTGLTVALFVAGEAYSNIALQGPAKMGALLSVLCVPVAFILSRILRVKRNN